MTVSRLLGRLGVKYWRTPDFWVIGMGRRRFLHRRQPAPAAVEQIVFRCNVCSEIAGPVPRDFFRREAPTCWRCGSTVRARAMIHALSQALFARDLALPAFPVRPDCVGLGLTDWPGYAVPLARALHYTNTFLHREPRLDIAAPDPALAGTLDFLTASDVFEHVPPPVEAVFCNAHRLLKPGGVLVLSVPYVLEGETVEHFPDLFDYRLARAGGRTVLDNVTRAGRAQRYTDLRFHGGPGQALEMRQFSQNGLLRALHGAGFVDVQLCDVPCPEHGILWLEPHSMPLVARAS